MPRRAMAAQAIRSGSIKTALVIGTETMSRILDWQGERLDFGRLEVAHHLVVGWLAERLRA